MGFREYYLIHTKDQKIFENVFNKFYEKGHFGKINKKDIMVHQKNWFDRFIEFIEERNEIELINVLGSRENKLDREYFTEITGIDVKHKTKEIVIDMIHEYIENAKNELRK